MTPERYQQVNALADAALEIAPEQRSAFLDEACAGDPSLRDDVEQLLGAQSMEGDFLEAPLLDQLAKDLAANPFAADLGGKELNGYQVLSRLGAGGIGEVWLARDARLSREVALKVLSPMVAGDPVHVRRLRQEARAASTLNHPNIVTIYEIGTSHGIDFIAQEFVRGQTLRQLLAAGPIGLPTVLDIGAQVASALAAAHSAGIVHRDIKPENIMLRADGLVKVLDFGLARFLKQPSAVPSTSEHVSLTTPGFVMGTVKYMSPEQARGLPVDARSDIFSLGVVLYEMIAGSAPFAGQTPSDVVAAILSRDPVPISTVQPGTPPALAAILEACLQKDPTARYASAQALRLDLERILQRLRFPDEQTPASEDLLRVRDLTARHLAHGAPAPRRGWAVPAAVALVVIAALAWWFFRGRRSESATSFTSMTMTRLVEQGQVKDAAISPDGTWVASVIEEPGGESIWASQIGATRRMRIVGPEDGQHTGLAFSSDSAWLAYRRTIPNGTFSLNRVALLGGELVRLHADLPGAAAFSPDDARYAWIQIDPVGGRSALMVANLDGSQEHAVAAIERPRYFSRYGLAWSPDGRSVACLEGDATRWTEHAFRLVEVRVDDGRERSLGSHNWLWGGSMAWPAHGGRLFLSATEHLDDAYQIWSVVTSTGETSKVTNDLSNYSRVSATSDGRTVLALQTVKSYDLWVAPHGDTDQSTQVTFGSVHAFNSMAFTPDGRLVYSALAGDYRNVWMIDASGGNLRQITSGAPGKEEVAVTPDGKYILYRSRGEIWRIGMDGSNPTPLTSGRNDVHPQPTPDSRAVVYASFRNWSPGIGGKPTLWRVPIDGGQPVPLSDIAASVPQVSPDGSLMGCEYFPRLDPQLSPRFVAILKAQGGEPIQVLEQLPRARSFFTWAPDGSAIEFSDTDGKVNNLWRMALSGGPPRKITKFESGLIAGYAWSRDGKALAFARGTTSRDIVLVKAAGQ